MKSGEKRANSNRPEAKNGDPKSADSKGGGVRGAGLRLVSPAEFRSRYESLRAQIEAVLDADEPCALVGIKRGGAVLARRLWKDLAPSDKSLEYGELDISFYRDDYHLKQGSPRVLGTEITFPVEGRGIVLIDDVLFTGRTVRAAIDQLLDFGRPRRIWLGVLIDRGHRELPISADFVGQTVETGLRDRVIVTLRELGDADDAVDLVPAAEAAG